MRTFLTFIEYHGFCQPVVGLNIKERLLTKLSGLPVPIPGDINYEKVIVKLVADMLDELSICYQVIGNTVKADDNAFKF